MRSFNGLLDSCRLVDEAFAVGVPVAVCSTSNEKAVSAIVRVLLGAERADKIRIFAGDIVPKKKPDPAIYKLAAKELNVDPSRWVLIQPSRNCGPGPSSFAPFVASPLLCSGPTHK